MIDIIYKDGKFLVKGTFKFGFVGNFENKDFYSNTKNILFDYNLDEIVEEIKNKNSSYYPLLKDCIVDNKIDTNKIIKILTDYYNFKEKQIEKFEKEINDKILFDLFINFYCLKYPFWEIDKICNKNKLKKFFIENKNCNLKFKSFKDCKNCKLYNDCITDIVYKNSKILEEFEEYFCENDKMKVIDNKNIDLELNLRKIFPMFNFNFLFNIVEPSFLVLCGKNIKLRFDYNFILDYEDWPSLGYHYINIDEDLSFSPIECYFDE